jgi:ATP-dependent Zn protease
MPQLFSNTNNNTLNSEGLDPTLLSPTRFNRQVVVNLPDIQARAQIIAQHNNDVLPENDQKINSSFNF